ncbi:4-dihydrotrisporin dehydrogenase [Pilaira anomala]|nr:4-dihydrotrisporin dehydrogenase [Pilaira anomala]
MSATYVVTGASRGLGLEFVKQISSKGHTVIALARNPDASEGLQKLVDNKKVFAFKLDAIDQNSIKSAVEEITKVSPDGVDYLINNAGITGDAKVDIKETPGSNYFDVFNTNVVGVSNITQAFLPLLRKRGQEKTKKIVNISSTLGSITLANTSNPSGSGAAYCVSKAALNMLTRMFAHSLKQDNIVVYAACPGWVKTDMGGANADIEPQVSIEGLLKVLESTTLEKSGSFISYDGKELPW